jgi:3-methyladenine DNA glycosylase/8-oxoguanine DNA glycosylase
MGQSRLRGQSLASKIAGNPSAPDGSARSAWDEPNFVFERIALRGAGGEPVDLRATLRSHGLALLPPNAIDLVACSYETTLWLGDGAHVVRVREDPPGALAFGLAESRADPQLHAKLAAAIRTIFSLDEDLSHFYAATAGDPDLSFASAGYGRLLRSPSAFEEVVRTICTTNCAWSATRRMIEALVAHLGTPARGVPSQGWRGKAFPTPTQVASAGDAFFRDVARAGYRGAYLRALAGAVAEGRIDLEAWRSAPRSDLPDADLEKGLRALPGVGPYAAAHIMLLFGRRSRLVLDSWTRPTYAALLGKKAIADRTIERRFRRYGDEAGLAFWLFLWKRYLAAAPDGALPP